MGILDLFKSKKKNKPSELDSLSNSDSGVRYHTARALGDLKDPSAVEPLIKALADPNNGVRMNSAKAQAY